jgi:hypothetical protein
MIFCSDTAQICRLCTNDVGVTIASIFMMKGLSREGKHGVIGKERCDTEQWFC